MKRIKYEDIKNSIQKYVRQRNYPQKNLINSVHCGVDGESLANPVDQLLNAPGVTSGLSQCVSMAADESENHLNLTTGVPVISSASGANSGSSANRSDLVSSLSSSSSYTMDINLMALNDITQIESSINDFYTYSFGPSSEKDYMNQFET